MISVWKPTAPRKKVPEQRLGQRFLGPLSMGAGHRIAMQAMLGCPALSLRATKQGRAISAPRRIDRGLRSAPLSPARRSVISRITRYGTTTSALPSTAEILSAVRYVRFVPILLQKSGAADGRSANSFRGRWGLIPRPRRSLRNFYATQCTEPQRVAVTQLAMRAAARFTRPGQKAADRPTGKRLIQSRPLRM